MRPPSPSTLPACRFAVGRDSAPAEADEREEKKDQEGHSRFPHRDVRLGLPGVVQRHYSGDGESVVVPPVMTPPAGPPPNTVPPGGAPPMPVSPEPDSAPTPANSTTEEPETSWWQDTWWGGNWGSQPWESWSAANWRSGGDQWSRRW